VDQFKNSLLLAVAGGAVGLIGNVVTTAVKDHDAAQADMRKYCLDMIHGAIASDEDKTKTNLRFLKGTGLLANCQGIDVSPALAESSSATPVQTLPPPVTPVSNAGTVIASGGMDVLKGCGIAGDATIASVRALNLLHNRYNVPSPASIDTSVTLARLLAPGTDTTRFDPDQAVAIEGTVVDVTAGPISSADCHATDVDDRSTQIFLVDDPARKDPDQRFLVEVTPRLRAIMKASNVDWSTATLAKTYKGKRVRVQGWLLFDTQHVSSSHNTQANHYTVTRATAWEVTPVTAIDLATAGAVTPAKDAGADGGQNP
jgi:hypothetical protein